MINGLISIIIPVYNTAKYLSKCVDSILKQSYENLEIILVDDGSTDGSGELCDRFEKRDSRIKVIHKNNTGSADSRNSGLKASKGEYVAFIDSDDWVDINMYEQMLKLLKAYNSDIVMCSYVEEYEGKISSPLYSGEVMLDNGSEYIRKIVKKDNKKLSYSVWKCLFKKNLVDGKKFPEGVHFCEDGIFLLLALKEAQKVCFIGDEYYHYRIHEASISNLEISKKRISDILYKCNYLEQLFNDNKNDLRMARRANLDELLSFRRVCKKSDNSENAYVLIDVYLAKHGYNIKDIYISIKGIVKYIYYRYLI